jgi:chemotaxis signal transduction protein
MRVLVFHAAGERYLVRLDAVRAVVRLRGLRRLPGSAGALSGVLDVQETPVAVYEARPPVTGKAPDSADSGDVLVLAAGWPDNAVGVACDSVEGLLELDDDTDPAALSRPPSLPGYVEQLMRVEGAMVPLVDVVGLAEAAAVPRGRKRKTQT